MPEIVIGVKGFVFLALAIIAETAGTTVRESCGIRSRASVVEPGQTGMERSGMRVSEGCGTE